MKVTGSYLGRSGREALERRIEPSTNPYSDVWLNVQKSAEAPYSSKERRIGWKPRTSSKTTGYYLTPQKDVRYKVRDLSVGNTISIYFHQHPGIKLIL
jgi:hypothetical protein